MNPIDRNIAFHFDKAYDGTLIFYPYMIGKGFYIKDLHYFEDIKKFLKSFYILLISTLIAFGCLIEPIYMLYASLCFLVIYHIAIKGYAKGLPSCPKSMSIDDLVLIRAKNLNYTTIWSGIILMLVSTPVLFIEAIVSDGNNLLFLAAALCGFATLYVLIRSFILKRHLPTTKA